MADPPPDKTSHGVYMSDDQKVAFDHVAREEGYSGFSRWALDTLNAYVEGREEALPDIKDADVLVKLTERITPRYADLMRKRCEGLDQGIVLEIILRHFAQGGAPSNALAKAAEEIRNAMSTKR